MYIIGLSLCSYGNTAPWSWSGFFAFHEWGTVCISSIEEFIDLLRAWNYNEHINDNDSQFKRLEK